MSQIIDYKVLLASSAEKLSEQVREHLKSGWQPHHGPSLVQFGMAGTFQVAFIQAIIKYKL